MVEHVQAVPPCRVWSSSTDIVGRWPVRIFLPPKTHSYEKSPRASRVEITHRFIPGESSSCQPINRFPVWHFQSSPKHTLATSALHQLPSLSMQDWLQPARMCSYSCANTLAQLSQNGTRSKYCLYTLLLYTLLAAIKKGANKWGTIKCEFCVCVCGRRKVYPCATREKV